MNICYVLDGILILYGVILTALYCRMRMTPSNKTPANPPEMTPSNKTPANPPEKQPAVGGVYAGLTNHSTDVYESINMDKKPMV